MDEKALSNSRDLLFSNRDIRRLLTPLIIEQFLSILVGMLDTLMVSSAGEAAISGVTLVNEVNFLIITLTASLATGGAVVASQFLGAKKRAEANRTASQLVLIAGICGLLLMFLALIGRRAILNFLYGSAAPDVLDNAVTYFWITALSFPMLGLYNACAAVFRTINRTNVTMWVSFLMNGINVIGNYIGVYMLHLGVTGVAWPSFLSRTVAAVILFIMAMNRKNALFVSLSGIFHWNGRIIRKIISIAVPNGIENGLFQLGRVLVASIVSTYGTAMIAANGVANSIYTLLIISSSALNIGIVPVVGRCVGADDYEQARYYIRKFWCLVMALILLNGALVWLALPSLLHYYNISPEGALLVRRIILISIFALTVFQAPAFTLPNAIRAAGDAKYTMVVGILSMFLVRISGAYLLGTLLGLHVFGVFLAMYLDWVCRSIFYLIRYRSGKWTRYRIV